MKADEWTWAEGGTKLHFRMWAPQQPAGVICLVHGLGEHSGRYEHVARFLTGAGYAVVSFDLRGHGKSGGQRGDSPSFEAIMNDIDHLFAEAADRFPGLPQFLYGHSLGGVLALNYALRRKLEIVGVVATSPGLQSAIREQKLKIAIARTLSNIFPTLSLPSGLDSNGISHDPSVVRKYDADPLVHGVGTLRMATETFDAIDWAIAHASEFPLPLLIMHGTDDPIAYLSGSQEFAGLVKGECTLKAWPGLYHELHNEPEQEQVLACMFEWLEAKRSDWEARRRPV